MRTAFASLSWLLAASALAANNPDFDRAVKLIDELQYTEASKALDAALQRPGNDRQTVLRVYELQGVVAATLNQGPQAVQRFQMLLSLEPDFKLKGEHPPRVTTAFFEAKSAIGEKGVVQATALPASYAEGRVTKLSVQVTGDPQRLIQVVRFHVRAGAGSGVWLTREAAVNNGRAAVKPNTGRVEWWAELLGEKGAVLITLADEAKPRSEVAPEPVDDGAQASSGGSGLKEAELRLDDVPEQLPPGFGLKVGAYSMWGVTVGLAVVGIVFGLDSTKDSNTLRDGLASVDGMGRVNGITQVQAVELEKSAKQKATLANGMFIGAGAAAVIGGALFFFGQRAGLGQQVSFHLLPGGAGVSYAWALP
ncbi:MAG: hypothetical protein JNG84_06440 [Archangium sp.]|nr:hypothetical protein [Archangium sp.]